MQEGHEAHVHLPLAARLELDELKGIQARLALQVLSNGVPQVWAGLKVCPSQGPVGLGWEG